MRNKAAIPFTQNYTVTMDGGKRELTIRAGSAATAMATALERNRGWSVTGCYAGGKFDPRYPTMTARIDFEVPQHDPLPATKEAAVAAQPIEMFDDATLIKESDAAKLLRVMNPDRL